MDPHHLDADLDTTCHPDKDPDSDFYFMRIWIRIRLFNLMRIQVIKMMQIHADPEPDPQRWCQAYVLLRN